MHAWLKSTCVVFFWMYSDSEYDEDFAPSPCPSRVSNSSSTPSFSPPPSVSSSTIFEVAYQLLHPPPPPPPLPPPPYPVVLANYLNLIQSNHFPRVVRRIVGHFLWGRLGGR